MDSIDTSTLFRVEGLVAVITGGGTGIGRTMALALATSGARYVFILGRRSEPLQSTAALHPGIIIPMVCDVSTKPALQAAVDEVTKRTADEKTPKGYINLLVANAGAAGGGIVSLMNEEMTGRCSVAELRKRLFEDCDMEGLTQAFHINYTGAVFTAWAFLELLDAGNTRQAGQEKKPVQSQIVTVASIAAFSRRGPHPYVISSAYGPTKAALVRMTKEMATMLGPLGIRANVLAPGLFPSDMTPQLTANRTPETETPADALFIPAKRFGDDEDMAGTILYMASRAGGYCNGMVFMPDGGRLSIGPASY